MIRRVLFPVLVILACLGCVSPLLAGTPSPRGTDDPDALRALLHGHHQREAAAKAAAAKAQVEKAVPPTANQLLWDVHHYHLDLDLDPAAHVLTGQVSVSAEVTGADITTMDLDLAGNMTVTGAWSGGSPTGFDLDPTGRVIVFLDRTYVTGETVSVMVSYTGNPAGEAFGWDSHAGQDMIWTLSEPFGARDWWPCKDQNTDKADSVDVEVTVPDDLIVASNGLLIGQSSGDGLAHFHWKTQYPIAPYLVSLAIHPYHEYHDSYVPLGGGDPMDVQFFVYPDHVGQVEATYALTVPMIGAFAQAFGEYPFVGEKYGHAEFTWGGGMEHQTLTSLGGWGEDLISHELAHQWWGDMITCADFGHIWLNEGFASWCEAYWKEQTAGFATYQQYMNAAAYYGPGTIFVEDTSNFGAIFDPNLSYDKGSWVVHMLRGILGDADFFAGLALYRTNHLYGTATTEDLQAAMETISGLDLSTFFQQWIYGEYFPVYSLGWTPGPVAGQITVTIDQVQENTGLFTMPIRLRVATDEGDQDFTVQNSLASQQYILTVTGTPQAVALDPDRWILRQIQSQVTNPTFDGGILLVNGVQWSTYGTEITSAYEDSTYGGFQDFDFWDVFDEPTAGYSSALPTPVGHGAVPAEVLGAYSAVVWVGNNYNGDLAAWQETPVVSYLEAGGNLLLLSRRSQSFLAGDLEDMLGLTWAYTQTQLGACKARYTGLVDIPLTGDQSWNDIWQPTMDPRCTMLFVDDSRGPEFGCGVYFEPVGGGTYRLDGGRFVHLAGRPYRMDHAALRQDVDFILTSLLNEPFDPVSAVPGPGPAVAAGTVLLGNHPNPFNPRTVISFELAAPGPVRLAVFDVAGHRIRSLIDGRTLPAGRHDAVWDGRDDSGRGVAAGVYFSRLVTRDVRRTGRMTLVR